MSASADLLDVVDRVVSMAEGGEQIEACVARSSDTEVRVYRGEVEQLAAADSLGVGVRIVREGRQGFAYCGTFDSAWLAEAVADRALRMLGATKPPSGRHALVLDPWVTAQLVGIVAGTLGAEEVIKARSLFAGRVGEQVASPLVTLVEDPTDARSWGAAPVDDEGLATRPVPLVAGGILQGFAHSTWTGRCTGTGSTGSAVRGGFKSTPTAACRVVALAPGGEVAEPLREFTIASTLQRLLHDVVAVGSDLTWLPVSAAGLTLVVGDVAVSGS